MQIAGYLKTSLIEWPGKISSVIFVPGCNFCCPFCHNRDLVDPSKIKKLREYSEESIFEDLKKRKKWVDGVVITGGEPTLQTDLSRFLSRLKQVGFLTMIETNGSRPEAIDKLLNCQMVDYIAMDIKGNFDNYQNFTNVKTQILNVKCSMETIVKSGVDFEFRTTVVPGLHNKEVLLKMAKQLAILLRSRVATSPKGWFLQNFQPKNCLDPEFEKIKPFSKEELQGFLKVVRRVIPQTEVRGV